MRVVAIIQARMGSTRLPGKVLADIVGRPMLWHVVERVRAVRGLAATVVATSDSSSDDAVYEFCRESSIDVYSGNVNDVLDRFYRCARSHRADVVLRVTGDCPLFDPMVVSQMLDRFSNEGPFDHMGIATGAGVAHLEGCGRFPDGLDAELTTFAALETAWCEATDRVEREHVTPFVWKRPERFRVATHFSPVDYSHLRWTVDNAEDLELVREIYSTLYSPHRHFVLSDVIALLAARPDLGKQNEKFIGQEGYDQFWKDRPLTCPSSPNVRHVA